MTLHASTSRIMSRYNYITRSVSCLMCKSPLLNTKYGSVWLGNTTTRPVVIASNPDTLQIPELKITKISKDLHLRQVTNEIGNSVVREQPLVVLFQWLGCTQTAVDKYCGLYHERGFDVLAVQESIPQFTQPKSVGFPLARHVLDYLTEERPESETFFVHATSIGAYNFTLCKMLTETDPKYRDFPSRVCGQVFDSLVLGNKVNMVEGIALSLSPSPIVQAIIRAFLFSYFKATEKHTVYFYDQCIRHFMERPITAPTLVFYSYDDPMAKKEFIHEMVDLWNAKKDYVFKLHTWQNSKHTAHIKVHKDDYRRVFTDFLDANFGKSWPRS